MSFYVFFLSVWKNLFEKFLTSIPKNVQKLFENPSGLINSGGETIMTATGVSLMKSNNGGLLYWPNIFLFYVLCILRLFLNEHITYFLSPYNLKNTISFIKPYRNPGYKCNGLRWGFFEIDVIWNYVHWASGNSGFFNLTREAMSQGR